MGRKILAVFIGAAAASALIFALESLSHRLYPPPAGLDFHDPAALKAFVAGLPAGAFALVLLSYALASLIGGMVATLVSGRTARTPALVVGGLLTAFGLVNLVSIPHPPWFAISSTLIYLPLTWLGSSLLLVPRGSR